MPEPELAKPVRMVTTELAEPVRMPKPELAEPLRMAMMPLPDFSSHSLPCSLPRVKAERLSSPGDTGDFRGGFELVSVPSLLLVSHLTPYFTITV